MQYILDESIIPNGNHFYKQNKSCKFQHWKFGLIQRNTKDKHRYCALNDSIKLNLLKYDKNNAATEINEKCPFRRRKM